ncbi:hypothetical protein ACH5RR_031259 [Cinchona calisaya]|uniref:Uncharacterized protein n=1 Tax=Cinchona calisaya TaxID=153742 RepID=A0ABD2YJ37_9GENT
MDGRNEQQLQEEDLEDMTSEQAETTNKAKTPVPTCYFAQAKKENTCLPLPSLHLLKGYESKLKHISGKKMNEESSNTSSNISCCRSQELSTDDIIKMARARLYQLTLKNSDVVSMLVSDCLHDNSGVPNEKYEDFELALLLQAAAVKFSNQQLDRARKLLSMCQHSASPTGNPLQRVVYYFTEALQERIRREMGGKVGSEALEGSERRPTLEEALTNLHPDLIKYQREFPFCQVIQFTAIQAILDNVACAKRIHLVDLGIKSGSHWPIMMQALADRHACPLELLKIDNCFVSDMKDLKEDFFELATDEVLAVYSNKRLASLLPCPNHLESLVQTIAKLNPCVMVISEFEVNTNRTTFVDRFNAELCFTAALFDCLEDCMDKDNENRVIQEAEFLGEAIQNVITTEGDERMHRKESIDFWRPFLTRFGIVEIALSDRALCQAKLIVRSDPRWHPCTLEVNGKGLIVGWKGTPIQKEENLDDAFGGVVHKLDEKPSSQQEESVPTATDRKALLDLPCWHSTNKFRRIS